MNLIERLKQLEAVATPGPWIAHGVDLESVQRQEWGYHIAEITSGDEDAQLIAEMRNALPKLLDVVGAVSKVDLDNLPEAERKPIEDALAALEEKE